MNAGMVLQILLNKNHKIFAKLKKSLYLCTAKTEKPLRQESLERLPLENRENSSVGRAQPCQGWGRGFESRFSLKYSLVFFDRKSLILVANASKMLPHLCPDGGIGRRATLRG